MKKLIVIILVFLVISFFTLKQDIPNQDATKTLSTASCLDYIVEEMEKDTYPGYVPIYSSHYLEKKDIQLLEGNGFHQKEDSLVFERGQKSLMTINFEEQTVSARTSYDTKLWSYSFEQLLNQDLNDDFEYIESKRLLNHYLKQFNKHSCDILNQSINELMITKTTYQDNLSDDEPTISKWWQVKDLGSPLSNKEFIRVNDWKEVTAIKVGDSRLQKTEKSSYGQFYVYWTDSSFDQSYYDDVEIFSGSFIWANDKLMNNLFVKIIDTPVFIVDLSTQSDMNENQLSAHYLGLEKNAGSLHLFANPIDSVFTHVGSFYSETDIMNELLNHVRLFQDNDLKGYDQSLFTENGYPVYSNISKLSLIGVY